MSNIKTKRVLVTPDLATKWLEKNTRNRPLQDKRVLEIAGWMTRDEWQVTTDAIGFDENGDLINGQHRLNALLKVNKPFEFIVTRGLNPDSFNVIDTVKVRSAADILGVNDFGCSLIKAGISKFIITFKKGVYSMNTITQGNRKLSNQEILDFSIDNRSKLDKSGEIARRTTTKFRGMEPRFIGGLYWLFSEKDEDMAETFFKYYEDGVGLTANDPILILRQQLIKNIGATRKVSSHTKLAWAVLAWNHIRSAKKIKMLKWSESDPFPKII